MSVLIARLFMYVIRGYQYFLSPLLGHNCRFHPSCSQYGLEALLQHGAWRGMYMTARRFLRCHPWHPGGYDPVPPVSGPRSAGQKDPLL